jgi:hypothetical protein
VHSNDGGGDVGMELDWTYLRSFLLLVFVIPHHVDEVRVFSHGQQHINVKLVLFVLVCEDFQRWKKLFHWNATGFNDALYVLFKLLAELVEHRRVPKRSGL